MDAVNAIRSATASVTGSQQTLGQDQFMKLMLAQFNAQNPLEPMANTEFLGQLAQFSVVAGVQQLDDSFQTLAGKLNADQVLQGAALLGKPVQRIADVLQWDGEPSPFSLVIEPGTTRVEVDVLDANGVRVAQLRQDTPQSGVLELAWDGTTTAGKTAEAGTYYLAARAVSGDSTVAIAPRSDATVSAVIPGSSGLLLELDDGSTVSLTDILQIRA
jgi:flagellar basal-body rod modification protein FlgD